MNNEMIFKHVDHTELKAFAAWEDIEKLCGEAIEYKTASVCIPPSYVKRVHDTYGDQINICTVIGFPLGYSTTSAKVAETQEAIRDGAREVDMVINISDVKNRDYQKVEDEIRAIRKASEGYILKVIIETCYLTEEEKVRLCQIVTAAGADYIKTSTGFGTGGATFEDIQLFRKHVGSEVKIKAAGGIRSREDCEKFLELGCDRLGTSSAVKILTAQE